jgi:HEAT repeat protein
VACASALAAAVALLAIGYRRSDAGAGRSGKSGAAAGGSSLPGAPLAAGAAQPAAEDQRWRWLGSAAGEPSTGQTEALRAARALANAPDGNAASEAARVLGAADPLAALSLFAELSPEGSSEAQQTALLVAIAELRNQEALPELMKSLAEASPPALVGAVQAAVCHMAAEDEVRELLTRYGESADEEYRRRVENVLRRLENADAAPALIEAFADPATAPGSALYGAIIEGLAHLGTTATASSLLQRLDSAGREEPADGLLAAIGNISGPHALSALQYAAEGNKEATRDQTRVAAILALRNYWDERTLHLLETLAADENQSIRETASQTLALVRPEQEESAVP